MKIQSIQSILAEHGFARAKKILAHNIEAARIDMRLERGASVEPVYVAAGLRYRLESAAARGFDPVHARHALFVLAGKYDPDVLAGTPTLTLNGTQPEIVEQAHALRRAEI